MITRRKYEFLKSMNSLTAAEQEEVDKYESQVNTVFKKPVYPKKKVKEPVVITKQLIWKYFKISYQMLNGKEFEENPDTLKNIAPVVLYFARDTEFFKSERLLTRIGKTELKPSFKKGLLIFGNYGNGKTSIMLSMHKFMQHYRLKGWFKASKSHELVTEYEGLQTPFDRTEFYKKYGNHPLYLDDVKKEKIASNFGKVDVIREIIEKRYDNNAITHITCNQREGDAIVDIEDTLAEFGERYGGHIYDRLFEMFNIIEFRGKSFRN